MVAGSRSVESDSSVTASTRMWKASFLDGHVLIPQLLPEFVASIDILEGDGGAGTIRIVNFTAVSEVPFVKDKLVEVDNEKKTFKIEVLEGGLIGRRLKSYSFTVTLEDTSEEGCKAKLLLEYDTIDDTPLSDEETGRLTFPFVSIHKAVDGYLQANPDMYA